MWVISRGRGQGKTTELVKQLLADERSVMVVPYDQRRDSTRVIVQMVLTAQQRSGGDPVSKERIDVVMQRVFTADGMRRGTAVYPREHFVLVDDLEEVLSMLLGNVVAVSINPPRLWPEEQK